MDNSLTLREWVLEALEAEDPDQHLDEDEWITIWCATRDEYYNNDEFEYSSSANRYAYDIIACATDESDDFALTDKMDCEVAHATHYQATGEWDIIVLYD